MKTNKWDHYFSSHYRPIGGRWTRRDVAKYKQWYYSWIEYIEERCSALRRKSRVFEIGSAVGAVAEILHEKGHMVTGSDISPHMVKIAAKLVPSVPFVACDIQKPISIKKKFDVIIGFEVIEHVLNLKSALKNIRVALKSDGYFIGTSPYPFNKNFLDPTHVNVKYPDQWKRLFYKSGFSRVSIFPMSFLPLAWRLSSMTNPVLPFYVPLPFFVSTTLIVAKK